MRRFEVAYGSRALHLLGFAAAALLSGYAVLRLADLPGPVNLLAWFVGAILLHDMLLFPLYAGVNRLAAAIGGARTSRLRASALNHLRIPVGLSLLLLLVWWPLILDKSVPTYVGVSGEQPPDYLERWLLLSGVFLLISALVFVGRSARRRAVTPRSDAS